MAVILLHRAFPAFLLIALTLVLALFLKLKPAGFFAAGFWIALTPAFWGLGFRGEYLMDTWKIAVSQLADGPYGRSGYSLVRRIIAPGVTNMWQLPEYAPEREYNLTAALFKSEMNQPEAGILPWSYDPAFAKVVTVLLLWTGVLLSIFVVVYGLGLCFRQKKVVLPCFFFLGIAVPVILYLIYPLSTILDIRFHFWIPVLKALLCGITADNIAIKNKEAS
ncbi:MAG: hypothetical protein IJ589_07995 [Lachnospiraceae bacterium]|nr:hypothetical protein [Lachnospiraceae bacterium]